MRAQYLPIIYRSKRIVLLMSESDEGYSIIKLQVI